MNEKIFKDSLVAHHNPFFIGGDFFDMNTHSEIKRLFPLAENQCINQKTKKMKKYFHTFRYQNGNIDRDITVAVTSEIGFITPCKVVVSYSVRTPEDRPEELPYESEALKRSREIALKKASRKPLDQLMLPKEYAVERGVLRAIALKWEKKIKKDGAHTYIKGVPAPDPESEVFRSESGKKIIVTRNEKGVHVNVPANIGSKIAPR